MASPVQQVFISYAIEDADFAQRLADDLKRLGARVWIAPGSILPSEPWLDAIERGLRESSYVVMVLTPAALEASGAKMERDMAITLALQDRIKLISLRVKPCEVPLVLSRYQMILAFQEDYEAGLNELAGHLGLRAAPPEGIERHQPTVRRSGRLLPLALAALLVLVICVVVIGVFASGLVGFPGGLIPIPTTPVPVVAKALAPTETQLPPSPSSAPAIVVVTATPLPATDAPTSVPPAPTSVSLPRPPTSQPPIPTPTVREKDDMEMVYVPGGTFQMGSTDGYRDIKPVHEVTLDGFRIDRTEVTNAQYARCVADGACSPPSKSGSYTRESYYGEAKFDDYPVVYVSWYDADTYCQWAGGRLPTEAEWEYAARGPDGHIYPWGNNLPNDTLANYNQNIGDTVEVGSYPDGASWIGAMDMAGNVIEWVSDWYDEDYYAISPAENPTGPDTGDRRVLRGGSLISAPYATGSTHRVRNDPDRGHYAFGFRCAVAPTSSP